MLLMTPHITMPTHYHKETADLQTCQKTQFLPIPPTFGTPTGVTQFEFRQDIWHQKTSPIAIVWHCLHFSYFGTMKTDRQTQHILN